MQQQQQQQQRSASPAPPAKLGQPADSTAALSHHTPERELTWKEQQRRPALSPDAEWIEHQRQTAEQRTRRGSTVDSYADSQRNSMPFEMSSVGGRGGVGSSGGSALLSMEEYLAHSRFTPVDAAQFRANRISMSSYAPSENSDSGRIDRNAPPSGMTGRHFIWPPVTHKLPSIERSGQHAFDSPATRASTAPPTPLELANLKTERRPLPKQLGADVAARGTLLSEQSA